MSKEKIILELSEASLEFFKAFVNSGYLSSSAEWSLLCLQLDEDEDSKYIVTQDEIDHCRSVAFMFEELYFSLFDNDNPF